VAANLEEIKKRLEDERSGAWDVCPRPDRLEISVLDDGPQPDVRTARFLAHVRADMEDLIEEVEHLRKEAGRER
jgi:hypothetical protein